MATEAELRAEIETVEKQLVDQNYIAKSVEAGDRRFGEGDWQVAQAALPVLGSRLKSLQGRLGSVIGGGGDPGGEKPKPETTRLPPRPPETTVKHATRPVTLETPLGQRDDLVGIGGREYDEIFDRKDIEERLHAEARDKVEALFREIRKIYDGNDEVYSFDRSTFNFVQTALAQLFANDVLNSAVAGHLRRELELKLSDRIDALERRLEATEKGGVRWMGTYQRAIVYQKGDVAQVAGSAWICLANSSTGIAPDSDPKAWQLFEKRRDERR